MGDNQKALKSGIWYTLSNFLVKSIGFITTPIFTRLLSHSEFGLYNNYISWLAIMSIVVTLNLDSTFISARFDFEDDFDSYIFSTLFLSSTTAAVSAVLLNATFYMFADEFGLSRVYLNTMMVYLLFLPAVNMFQARERYFFKYKISVLISLIVSIGTAALSVALVVTMDDRLAGRIAGTVIPTILVGLVLYLIIAIKGKRIKLTYWKYAIPISLPFIPHLLSLTVLNSVDKIMINHMCGPEDNALYSLAYTCGAVITLLITSMNSAFAPWLGQKLHAKQYTDINSFAKKYIVVFISLAAVIMIFAPNVLLILGDRSYYDAVYVMPPVACGCVFQFLYTMFVNVEQFSRKTIGMAIASCSAAILNYALNLIFIPRCGYIAAAYTTLAGYLWLLIIHMLLVRKYGFKDVYPYKFVAGVSVVAVFVSILVNYLYQNPVLRYSVGVIYCLILGCVLIRYKDYLIRFYKGDR